MVDGSHRKHMMPDLLAEAEKGGRSRRLLPLSEIHATLTGQAQEMVHPQWLEGGSRRGPHKGPGSDPAT
jgi:hypothetical protein